MGDLIWLSEVQMRRIEPHVPHPLEPPRRVQPHRSSARGQVRPARQVEAIASNAP